MAVGVEWNICGYTGGFTRIDHLQDKRRDYRGYRKSQQALICIHWRWVHISSFCGRNRRSMGPWCVAPFQGAYPNQSYAIQRGNTGFLGILSGVSDQYVYHEAKFRSFRQKCRCLDYTTSFLTQLVVSENKFIIFHSLTNRLYGSKTK